MVHRNTFEIRRKIRTFSGAIHVFTPGALDWFPILTDTSGETRALTVVTINVFVTFDVRLFEESVENIVEREC